MYIVLLNGEARRQHSVQPSPPAVTSDLRDPCPGTTIRTKPRRTQRPGGHRFRAASVPPPSTISAPVMTLLLPSLQAERIRRSIVDYLSTTFALTDAEPRRVLADFLQDEEQGGFVGPFVRLRLPYLAASARAASPGRAGQPGQSDPPARPGWPAPVTNPAATADL